MKRKIQIIILCIIVAATFFSITYLFSVAMTAAQKASEDKSFDYNVKNIVPLNGHPKKNVLFISSYSPNFQTYDYQINGIKSVLDEQSVALDIEYMDTKRYYTEENLENFYNNIKYKMTTSDSFDAIIIADDNALEFTMLHQDELFKDIPIVFLGINNLSLAISTAQDPYITGVVEVPSIAETIEIAYKINPDAQRVVALVDSTTSGRADLEVYYDENKKIDGLYYDVIDLSDYSFDEFAFMLNELDNTDIILLISVYKDKTGITCTFDEGLHLVLENCSQPVYHPYYHGLGSGIIGGDVVSHFDQAHNAALMVKRVLDGEDIANIPCVTESPNKIIFDKQVLDKFNIDSNLLPDDVILVNNPDDTHKIFLRVSYALLLVLLELSIIIAFGVNIARRFKAEAEIKILEKKSTELEAALIEQQRLKSIGTLASGVAHEINNPINCIMNFAQLIKDDYGKDTQVNEFAEEILYESERISSIVRNLLSFSRQEDNDYTLSDMNDIINNALSLIKSAIKTDSIQLNIDIDKGLPVINCNSQRIQQIIMNLITNARDSLNKKYKTPNENKVINLSCKVYSTDNKDYIRVTVEDFGTGIDKEIKSHIYDPFFTTKSRDEGTGLGLSISKRIAKQHGGNLSFDTKDGEYTKFYLDLPIQNEERLNKINM